MMHDPEKSDVPIVAVKPTNAAGRAAGEPVEPRGTAEGNARRAGTVRAQHRDIVSCGLERVRQAARERKEERFTTLLHHIDVAALHAAYFSLERNAAAGIDGMTWQEYGRDLAARLDDLHGRVQRGAYRA